MSPCCHVGSSTDSGSRGESLFVVEHSGTYSTNLVPSRQRSTSKLTLRTSTAVTVVCQSTSPNFSLGYEDEMLHLVTRGRGCVAIFRGQPCMAELESRRLVA